MNRHAILFVAALALSPASASADGAVQKLIIPADKIRLDHYGETRRAAIVESRKGAAADVSVLDGILKKPFLPFAGFDMVGNWQCRTIKVGELNPIVVYGWFKCRVTDDGSGWMLAKTSGSQRTTGRFYDDGEKRLIYLGSLSVNTDKPKPYGSGPESDQVGYAFRTGPKEFLIEFPAPFYESKLDIMEFKR